MMTDRLRRLPNRLQYLIVLLAGMTMPLALAPFFWWPIGVVSLLPLIILLYTAPSSMSAFVLAWSYAFGAFLTGVSWIYVSIHTYGGTPAWLAIFMVVAFAAALALIPAGWFMLRHRVFGKTGFWLTFPVFWFLHEWCRSWLLTGFPWLFLGDAHLHSWLSGWAPVLGSYGISLFVALTASALWQALRLREWRYLLVLLVWPIGWQLQSMEWTQVNGELRVAAVQGNVRQDLKWLPESVQPTLDTYFRATREHWQADLILWPETAVTLLNDGFRPYQAMLAPEARANHTTVITGIPFRYPAHHPLAGEFHNSLLAFGQSHGWYHKQRLVPFGEYVPLERQLRGLMPFFDLAMSSFLPGPSDQSLLPVLQRTDQTEKSYFIAPYICYEIAYPSLVRQMAKEADLLITVSNDAWFGDSLGPKQHLALAQMRALENQRYVLRATNTGITALIDERGNIVERLPYERQATLTGVAQTRYGQTPYMRWGLIPLWLISFCVLAGLGYPRLRAIR
ncbi:MAG: apolipoprotein N-acyltransferase [Bacterioplanes sp.]|nr:apolipoprotein N-acyltransferase [Bacterioplanes sp.]